VSEAPLVLVLDDEASVRTALRRLLGAEGYRVAAFATSDELLADPRLGEGGCLLLDLRMPGRSGLEVQAELRRRGVPLPIVFLTGHGDAQAHARALAAGAVAFLAKPWEPAALLEAVGRAVTG
jgi:FixJ family two-component response regulator